ncbi:unnamed protein product [Lactuca saligna]|uniref:Uncharacterized protein n=1 Tax=Lactuca saligna TaxID=75948 RepID=A0AA35YV34_LACSI|nr:unnamed protein product [Lactuca saligna]
MEVVLKDVLENFPDSILLKEWFEKNHKLFIEVKNEGNEGMNDKEHTFDANVNKGAEDIDNEGGISLIRALVVYGDKKDDGGSFNIPIIEHIDNTDHLNCSQFLEHHEVLAKAIEMTDEAVLKSYSQEKKY